MILSGLHPVNHPDAFASHTLGSMRSPGVVSFSGHDRNENWEVQEARGNTGASTKHKGRAIGHFQATYYLASDQDDDVGSNDFLRWEEFHGLLESLVSGKVATALQIYHPDLARNRITEVSVESIGGLVWDDRGGATAVVKYIDFRPPKPKPVAAAKAKANPAKGQNTKPDPNAAAKQELAKLVQEAKKP